MLADDLPKYKEYVQNVIFNDPNDVQKTFQQYDAKFEDMANSNAQIVGVKLAGIDVNIEGIEALLAALIDKVKPSTAQAGDAATQNYRISTPIPTHRLDADEWPLLQHQPPNQSLPRPTYPMEGPRGMFQSETDARRANNIVDNLIDLNNVVSHPAHESPFENNRDNRDREISPERFHGEPESPPPRSFSDRVQEAHTNLIDPSPDRRPAFPGTVHHGDRLRHVRGQQEQFMNFQHSPAGQEGWGPGVYGCSVPRPAFPGNH